MSREMEQARYWMWTKHNTNHHQYSIQSSTKNSSYYDSWEEQAFAEDAAGSLGGCIWPPRSYSCSFCRREFRSAQALGGHMNVHRRDRARLKLQSSTTPNQNENIHDQEHQETHLNQIGNQLLPLKYQYPSHAFPMVNPNPALFHQSTSLPCSRLPAQPMHEKSTEEVVSESDFHVQENHNRSQIAASSPFWSKLVSQRNQSITDLTSEEKIISSEPARHGAKDGCMKTDLSSVSFSLAPSKNTDLPDMPDKAAAGCKRRREYESSEVSFVNLRSTLTGRNYYLQSEVFKNCPSSSDDLDLELRLGDRPKVK